MDITTRHQRITCHAKTTEGREDSPSVGHSDQQPPLELQEDFGCGLSALRPRPRYAPESTASVAWHPGPAPILSWCESMWRNFLRYRPTGHTMVPSGCCVHLRLPVTLALHTLYLLRPSSKPKISRGLGAMKSSTVATSACTA